jgi:hypothetical protein
MNLHFKKIGIGICMTLLALVHLGRAQTVIYSDNFNIPDTLNFNTSSQTGRHTGLLATNVVGQSGGIQLTITNNQLNLLAVSSGTTDGRMRFHNATNTALWWNWATNTANSAGNTAGAQILADGGMKISFDWTAADNTSANWISYSVGITPNSDTSIRVANSGTDSGILLRNNGGAQVFKLGSGGATATFDVTSLTRHVDLNYAFTSWNDGTLVTLNAFVNGTLVISQTFNWNANSGVQNMELASIANGTKIDNFTVTSLAPPPSIAIAADTSADSPATNYIGRTVTLSAGIAGTAPITNQWKVDKGSGFVNVANATNSTLVLANAQISDAGNYKLFASNSAGSTNTTPLQLTFVPAPTNNDLVNLQFTGFTGGGTAAATQTDAAVIGNPGDIWNALFTTAGSFSAGTGGTCSNTSPIFLNDSANIGTAVSLKFVADYIYNAGPGAAFTGSPVANLMSGLLGLQSGRTGMLTLSNLVAGTYDLYLYGYNQGAQTRSSTFTANGLSAVCGPNSNVGSLTTPNNYVHLVTVTSSGVLTITFTGAADGNAQLNGLQLNGPLLIPTLALAQDTTLSTPATVYAGNTVTFTAAFGGTQPITNQWMVDKGGGFVNVSGATNTTLILTNVQISDSGNYALFVANAAGNASSTPVALTVLPLPTNLTFNVQFTGSAFGSGNAPTQTDGALIGNPGDVWNAISNPNGDASPPPGRANATNLLVVDALNVGTTVTLDYVADYIFNGRAFGSSGPFYDGGSPQASLMTGYMGSVSTGGNADTNTVTLHNLVPGSYDLYLYAAGRNDGQTRVNVFTANGQTAVCGPNNGNNTFIAGTNYVHLTPLVTTNGLLNISFYGTADAGQALMNGFQLNGPVTTPTLFLSSDTTSDSPATNYAGRTITLSAAFGGYPAPALQWKVNYGSGFVNVSASATNSSLTLANAQTGASGTYALFASNVVGASNSTPVALTVLAAPTNNFGVNLDVQFIGTSRGTGFGATQAGSAVIGNAGDFWNPVSNPNPVLPSTAPIFGNGQILADAASIGTTLTLDYTGSADLNTGAGNPFAGSGSPAEYLMQAALTAENNSTATVTVHGILPGTYDLYLYSSAGNGGQANVSQFTANGTTASVGPNSGNNVLTAGVNYLHLTPVVTGNGLLNISLVGNGTAQAQLNGFQLSGPGATNLFVTVGIQQNGSQLTLTWPNGTLLEATNLLGPWITNGSSSPYVFTPSATTPQKFFRVQVQ